MKRIARTQVSDPNLQRWMDNAIEVVRTIGDKEILNGTLVEGVSLAQATNTFVSTSLARVRGWIVVDCDKAVAGLRRVKSSEVIDGQIVLYADTVTSGPATLTLWVF